MHSIGIARAFIRHIYAGRFKLYKQERNKIIVITNTKFTTSEINKKNSDGNSLKAILQKLKIVARFIFIFCCKDYGVQLPDINKVKVSMLQFEENKPKHNTI